MQKIKDKLNNLNYCASIEDRYSIEYPGSIEAAYEKFESKLEGFQLQTWSKSSDIEKMELFHHYVEFYIHYDDDRGDTPCMRIYFDTQLELKWKNHIWM